MRNQKELKENETNINTMNCENKKKFTELNAQIVNKNNKIKELNEKIKILTKADNANINIPKSKDKIN